MQVARRVRGTRSDFDILVCLLTSYGRQVQSCCDSTAVTRTTAISSTLCKWTTQMDELALAFGCWLLAAGANEIESF